PDLVSGILGRNKKVKAKSSSHDVGLDEAQRELRASLAQAKRVEVQKDLEEKVAAKERATGAHGPGPATGPPTACFAGIEDRLLPEKRTRPPLAADRASVAMPAPATVPSTSGQPQAPKPSKGKGRGKKSQAAAPLAPSTCADAQVELGTVQAAPLSQPDDAGEPSATPPTETWTEVVKRGKKKKTVPKITPAAPAANRAPAAPLNKGVKLAAPRSAAVTVTITPEAAERGETYESVLTRARGFADPIQLGIGPIKCRRTQTGARLFEFPGAAGSQNADLFAAKLREGIADVAKVARPVKSATLEVVDLDDSVSANEVVAAIAAAGGCSVEAVHGRTIWTGRRGLGMTRVDCPVTAAKARAYLRQESDDSSESVLGRKKKVKAKSSSHDVGLDEAQRQLRASLAQAKRVEVQKDLEEKVAAKERATGAARSRAGYGASNVLYRDRLLPEKRIRPPLAADRAPVAMPAPATVPSTSGQPQAPKPSKGKGKGRKSQAAAPLAPSTCADAQVELGAVQAAPPLSQQDDAGEPSATPPTETWTEVVKRGKRKKAVPKITPAAPAANRAPAAPLNKGVKLAAPRSAAVTVTITPEAAERGETYESVLTRARGFADPIQLGIGPIKCRRTQTGARLFEFPGAAGSQNADLFAAKLREGIADVAKVARPVKSATLEVVDLDDSVSMNEVVAAIAAAGGCSVEAVHGRTIWTGRRGLGMTRVDCPVTAAK
ncbi:hypothetical protein SFRURICE_019598, partial [Spodoptera frugiperda]